MPRSPIRKLLMILFVAASASTAFAQTNDDDDDERSEREIAREERENRSNLRQLQHVTKQIAHQDERLAKVLNQVGPPDQPVPTELRAALVKVGNAAGGIVARVSPYLGTAPPPPPPPPGDSAAPGGAAGPGTSPGPETPVAPRHIRRIESIARRLAEIDERLARILNQVGPPDQPVPTEIRTELGNVAAGARGITTRVAPYLGSGGGSAPPGGGAAPPGGGSATPGGG